jgi:S-formylglutathione hydrolase FrmB
MRRTLLLLVLTRCAIAFPALADEAALLASAPTLDAARHVQRITVKSPHQKGQTIVEILLPDHVDTGRPHKVVYVLPVEPGIGGHYGDGLMEVRKLDLHNAHNVICVTMSFDTIPWYMNHATDPHVQQETYLKQVVLLIESQYKTPGDRTGRLLLGFSKSGYGAIACLLRDPDFYGCAAAWDSPLMLKRADWRSFEIPRACGTQDRFADYHLESLVAKVPDSFKKSKRVAVLGEASFGGEPGKRYAPDGHTQLFHKLLERASIPHAYNDDIRVPHTWSAGWLKPAFETLIALSNDQN